jgi:hypothetical protein
MKRNFLGIVIGSIVGGIAFYPLTMPISLTILLQTKFDPNSNDWLIDKVLSWVIPMIGIIFGGLVAGYIRKNKIALAPFKSLSISIIFWFVVIFGVLGLDIGFWFSGITLIGLGNTSTAIDLWIFSAVLMIIGIVIGALFGLLIALLRLAINKLHTFSQQV